MRALARGIVAEKRQIHTAYRVLWRKRDSVATTQKERAPTLA